MTRAFIVSCLEPLRLQREALAQRRHAVTDTRRLEHYPVAIEHKFQFCGGNRPGGYQKCRAGQFLLCFQAIGKTRTTLPLVGGISGKGGFLGDQPVIP